MIPQFNNIIMHFHEMSIRSVQNDYRSLISMIGDRTEKASRINKCGIFPILVGGIKLKLNFNSVRFNLKRNDWIIYLNRMIIRECTCPSI